MRVLVTGGSGYIGSHTVRALLERGDEVINLDRRPPAPAATGLARFVQGEVGDRRLLEQLFSSARVDSVIHLAAEKSVEESMREPAKYYQTNVAATVSLLEAMRQAGVDTLVFSSTCAVYGTPETVPVNETSPVRAESPYGASKAMAEEVLHWFEVCHGLRSLSLRYFNAAGAALDGSMGEDPSVSTSLIPLVMEAACGRGGPVRIFGTDYPTPDGTAIRDYIHVVDIAEAHVRAVDHLAGGGASAILNLGTGQGSSVLEVIEAAKRASGREFRVEPTDRRSGDVVAVWADGTKARQVIGWAPRLGLEEIVASAWRWHSGLGQQTTRGETDSGHS